MTVVSKVGEVEEQLLDNCRRVLQEAQEAYDEAGGDEGARQRNMEEEDQEDEDAEGDELVYDLKAEAAEATEAASMADAEGSELVYDLEPEAAEEARSANEEAE